VRSAKYRYLSYSEANLRWCNDKGTVPQKLKILLKFYQILDYKQPAGVFPLSNFHEICRVCTLFEDALAVKICMNLLKSLWSYVGS